MQDLDSWQIMTEMLMREAETKYVTQAAHTNYSNKQIWIKAA